MKAKRKPFALPIAASLLKRVDEWRRNQRDRPSRAVAIRRLAERGLASTSGPRKAVEMADREIERRLGDQAVNKEERARRKRQLIQGPREFRGIRANPPKIKD